MYILTSDLLTTVGILSQTEISYSTKYMYKTDNIPLFMIEIEPGTKCEVLIHIARLFGPARYDIDNNTLSLDD